MVLARGGGILFSGCDQIQELLGMGGDEESAPTPAAPENPAPTPPDEAAFIGNGGEREFVQKAGQWYEIHTFRTDGGTPLGGQTESALTFGANRPETVEVLVVADGGAGAGGYIYVSSYPVPQGETVSIMVKAGAGGAKSPNSLTMQQQATSRSYPGGDSEFGGIRAKGGGGGSNHVSGSANTGGDGGSGGGTANNSGGAPDAGTVPESISDPVKLASAGGQTSGSGGRGGGGGGAGGAKDMTEAAAGDLTPYGATAGNNGDPHTGDGGSGGGNREAGDNLILSGGVGGSGIVIVRFPR